MLTKRSFQALVAGLPFGVNVRWDVAPSAQKYAYVNTLLSILSTFYEEGATLSTAAGTDLRDLIVQPLRRRLTDQKKRTFTLAGHDTATPLVLARLRDHTFEIFFNHHVMVEAETTYRQYFPSAAVIVRCRDLLQWSLTRSPGSWGSDVICMTFDWGGTLLAEAMISGIPSSLRPRFRGYKLVQSPYKFVVAAANPSKRERGFLMRNGVRLICGNTAEESLEGLKTHVRSYLEHQLMR
jgi:hypothetical protein